MGAGKMPAGINGQGDTDPPNPGNLKQSGVRTIKGGSGHRPAAEEGQEKGPQKFPDKIIFKVRHLSLYFPWDRRWIDTGTEENPDEGPPIEA